MSKGWITAAELHEKQQKDPEFQRKESIIDKELDERHRVFGLLEAEAIIELKNAGYDINTIAYFINTRKKYPEAIPILIKYLHHDFSETAKKYKVEYHGTNGLNELNSTMKTMNMELFYLGIKESIVRSLAVKEAKGIAGPHLIAEYRRTPREEFYESYRWTIGLAMSVVISKQDLEDVIEIVRDKENGHTRAEFIRAIGKFTLPQIEDVLIDVLENPDDDQYSSSIKEAIKILARKKSVKAAEKIKMYMNHPDKLVRKEADKAYYKIMGINQ